MHKQKYQGQTLNVKHNYNTKTQGMHLINQREDYPVKQLLKQRECYSAWFTVDDFWHI